MFKSINQRIQYKS